MNNFERYDYEPFAEDADNNGQFGSAYAGNKTLTNDIGQIQALPNYKQGWRMAEIGSEIKAPTLEEMQGLQYMTSYGVSYLMQKGIPEWSAGTTYYYDDLCKQGGMIWRCLSDEVEGAFPSIGNDYYSVFNVANVNSPMVDIFQDSGVYLAVFLGRVQVYYSDDLKTWTGWNPKNNNQWSDDINMGRGALDADNHCAYICGYHASQDNAKREICIWKFDFLTKTFTRIYSQRVEGRVNYCAGLQICGDYLVVYGHQPANARLKEVTVFTKTGTFIGQWGLSWSSETTDNYFNSVAYRSSDGLMVLTDQYNTNGSIYTATLDSTTGQISGLTKLSTGLSGQYTCAFCDGSNFYVGTTAGKILTSSDGSTWSEVTAFTSANSAQLRVNGIYEQSGTCYILCLDYQSYSTSDWSSFSLARFGNTGLQVSSATAGTGSFDIFAGASSRGWVFGYDEDSTENAWEPLVLRGNSGSVTASTTTTSVVFAEAFPTVCVSLILVDSTGASVSPMSKSNTGFSFSSTANATYYYTAQGW